MIIFTDGSTINNGKKNAFGGVGIYIPSQNDNEDISLSYKLISNSGVTVTNQIAELVAIILAIEHVITIDGIENETINIYTDSKYVIDCATTWSESWIKKQWKKANNKTIDNLWLIYRLIQLNRKYPIIFKHVRSHQPEPVNKQSEEYVIWKGNEQADNLAKPNNNENTLQWKHIVSIILEGINNDITRNTCNIPILPEMLKTFQLILGCDVSN